MLDQRPQEESLRDLLARLIDSGKAYIRAELTLVRKTAKVRLIEARFAAGFGIGAVLLANAGLIVLLAAFGLALGRWLGPAGGLAVAGLVALAIAGILVRCALSYVKDWKSE